MDVESKETLAAAIAQAKTAGDEIVDRANTALTGIAEIGIQRLSAVASGLLTGLRAACDTAVADARDTIELLDGWTLEVAIPPITIRLSKPKEAVKT